MSTKCKSCKREVPDNATFCPWCGQKQVRERKKDGVIKVPEPKQLPSGSWRIYLRAEQQSVTEPTKDRCIAKAKAIRAGFVEQQKKAKDQPLLLSEAIENYITRRTLLSPNTIRGYRIYQKNRFKSCQGVNIREPVDWQSYINEEAALCAPKTLKNAWGFIKSVLEENGIAAPKVTLPKLPVSEHKWLTPEQIIVFCKAIEGKSFEKEALFALHSLRRVQDGVTFFLQHGRRSLELCLIIRVSRDPSSYVDFHFSISSSSLSSAFPMSFQRSTPMSRASSRPSRTTSGATLPPVASDTLCAQPNFVLCW